MEDHLLQSKEIATTLSQSKNQQISNLGKQLLAEVTKSTTEGFTAGTLTLTQQIKAVALADLIKSIAVLNTELPKTLKGIDLPKLIQSLKNLDPLLRAQLKAPEISKIRLAAEGLGPILIKLLVPPNYNLIRLQAEIVVSESSNTTEVSLKDALNQAQSVLANFDQNVGTENEWLITNAVSDIVYFVEIYVSETNGVISPKLQQAIGILKSESANSSYLTLIESIKEVLKVVAMSASDADKLDQIRYTLADFVSAGTNLEAKLDPQAKMFLQVLKAELDKYRNEDTKSSLDLIAEAITQQNKSDIIDYAGSLNYSFQFIIPQVNAVTQTLIEEIKLEMTKSQTQEILTTMAEAYKVSQEIDGEINDELLYSLTGASYYFQEELNLPASLKAVAENYVASASVLDSYTNLNVMVKQSPDKVDAEHFYFYGDIRRLYELTKSSVSDQAPKGTVPEAHLFLTQLCGEFRDRATMIEAKLNWVKNLFILKGNSEAFTIDPTKNVWSQIPASAYYPYTRISSAIWEAKREAQPRYITIGEYNEIDNPVPGFTVCETKYIFSEYIGKNKEFSDYDSYVKGLASYSAKCSQADTEDYYDFRGDSNFKHYSPESNGMIWYATTIGKACRTSTTVKNGVTTYTNEDCENYFKRPFYYRYNAARAGLSAWLFRDDQYRDTFSSQGSMVAIYPHTSPDLAPFSFSFDNKSLDDLFAFDQKWLSIPGAWNRSDIGMNEYTGMGTANADLQMAYERLRDAVDRHTDWYSSGYNDKNGTIKDQAYSPFVASSYDMSASDGFTSCGITVQCPPDGLKRWMFIFRIKPQNWYNPARILKGEPLDFDTMWLDETSFGISGLADSEKAWDRLGTPMEEELDSILYLINVSTEGGFEGHGE
ncbi:MAG: hypothetical protein K2Q26_09765 [Bdellovibrionales bacterium]|nr:hypothetical protein [Bdellovibrionales bacterium]